MFTFTLHRGGSSSKLLAALLLSIATLSSGPAHAFGRKPVQPPAASPTPKPTPSPTPTPIPTPVPSASPSPQPQPVDVIRARWEPKNRDGAEWSKHVYEALPVLAPKLLAKAPADVATFCPAYSKLSEGDRRNFWVYLLSGMTEFESGHNPAVTYKENFKDAKGNYVISRGLLQISIESGNAYGCGFKTEQEIHDPIKNLDCGLKILNRWIGSDGVISGHSTSWLGGARYWSVLRAPKVSEIQGFTKALRMCAQ